MPTQTPTRSGRRWIHAAVLAPLVLAACAQDPGPSPAPSPPADAPTALVYGTVSSPIYDALRGKVRMTVSDGSQKPSDYGLVIADGDHFDPQTLATDETIRNAVRGGVWVLGLDLAEDDKRDGIGRLLGASTHTHSAAYLIRRTRGGTGHFRDRIVDLDVTSGTAEQNAASILRELGRTDVLAQQDVTPGNPPPSMLHHTYVVSQGIYNPAINQKLYLPRFADTPAQQASWTVDTTVDIYLDNSPDYPNGPRQWAVVQTVGSANPGTLISNNPYAWYDDLTAEVGWFQTQFSSKLNRPGPFSIHNTSPTNVNGSETVTTTQGFSIGATGGVQNGKPVATVNAGYSYSHSVVKTITDWQVRNASTSDYALYQFASNNPVNGLITDGGDDSSIDWCCAYGRPAEPNRLSLNTLQYETLTVLNTDHGQVTDRTVTFTGQDQAWYSTVARHGQGVGEHLSTDIKRQNVVPQPWSLDVNMGFIVPVPMSKMTFNGGNDVIPGQQCVPVELTLAKDAPADLNIPLYLDDNPDFGFANKNQCSGSDGQSSNNEVFIRQGGRTGTAYLNVAGATPVGAVGKVMAFYTAPLDASFSVAGVRAAALTLDPPAVLAGQQATGTLTLAQAVATDTDIPITVQSVNQNAAVPDRVTVRAGQKSAFFPVDTNGNAVSKGDSLVVYVKAGGTTLVPLKITNVAVTSLDLSPAAVIAGQPSTGTLVLDAPVRDGTDVLLSSDSPNATVPKVVTLSAGASSTNFTVTTRADGLDWGGSTTATVTAPGRTAPLTVRHIAVALLSFDPNPVVAGRTTTGTVMLDTTLQTDTVVPLTSGDPQLATVPPTVTVSAGQNSATFTVQAGTTGVTSGTSTTVAITAGKASPVQLTLNGPPPTQPMVNAANTYSCALRTNTGVVCWGATENENGSFTPLAGLAGLTQLTDFCGLTDLGTVRCWGNNPSNFPGPLSNVIQLSSGQFGVCAVRGDGSVACWGRDTQSTGALNVPAGLSDVQQVSTSGWRSCALKKDGTVVCWGAGVGFDAETGPPPGLSGVTQVSAGGYPSCALRNDGTVVCWGTDPDGVRIVPPADLSGVTQVSVGRAAACALKNDGTVVCWGPMVNGASWPGELTPPPGLSGVIQIDAGFQESGSEHACALKNDGTVVCWGGNSSGQAAPPPGLNLRQP